MGGCVSGGVNVLSSTDSKDKMIAHNTEEKIAGLVSMVPNPVSRPLPAFQCSQEKWQGLVCDGT